MLDLVVEYQQTLRKTRKLAEKQTDAEHISAVNGMIYDLQYALEWMKTGSDPNEQFEGKADQSFYHRRVLLDMDRFPCLDLEPTHSKTLEDNKKIAIQRVLAELTEKQLTCFLLHAAHMRSFQEIADELGVKKATVQGHIEAAREHIKRVVEVI